MQFQEREQIEQIHDNTRRHASCQWQVDRMDMNHMLSTSSKWLVSASSRTRKRNAADFAQKPLQTVQCEAYID